MRSVMLQINEYDDDDDEDVFACNFRGGAGLTELSQGCVNQTSPNVART